jgi:phosphoribosyl 1,2-cyclic phosphodiesterase
MHFTGHASSSRGNLYLVESGSTRLLLEAGLPIKTIRRRLGWTLSGVAGSLVTHEHMDHARGAADLLRAGVDVWCSAGTAQALGLEGHRLHLLRSAEQCIIGELSVLPFATEHEAAEPLGFLLQDGTDSLMFATDTGYLRWRFEGLTLIAIECNFAGDLLPADMPEGQRARLEATHLSLASVKAMLAATDLSRVREIHLLHLSSGHADAERFRSEIEAQTGIPTWVEAE